MICLLLIILPAIHLCCMLYAALAVSKEKRKDLSGFPFVSILIAARNEENNILRCLESLSRIDYPSDKWEVWIGDDMSEDTTADLIETYISGKSNFHLLRIRENVGLAKGKANVLAQLAHKAKGEVFFVTDADIAVPATWIKAQLPYLNNNTAIVSGTTVVEPSDTWSSIQRMEWLYLMGFYHIVDKQLQITANGNNMCFQSSAYFATGGYENIPFSVTEDYALMQAMKKLGYRHRHVLEPEGLCLSRPTEDLPKLLKQRNRWLSGGKGQPWYSWFLLLVYLLFLPLTLLLAICNLQAFIILFILKILLDLSFIARLSRILKLKTDLQTFPLFEFYQFIFNLMGISYFLLRSGKVEWKGRNYGKA